MASGKHSNSKKIKNDRLNNGLKSKKENKNKTKNKKKKKILVAILCIVIIIVLGIFAYVKTKLNKLEYVDISNEDLGIEDSTSKNLENYRNIALLGVDSRNISSNDGSRSDSIIIVSINKETNDVKLISVYRDTYLDLGDKYGLDKVTHAYAYNGPSQTINTLNRNLDLNIKEFVTVNFEVVADVVDLIGGIEVDIKEEELSQMNKYIEDTSKHTGIPSEKLTHAGKQTLNGVQAVTYSRIRKTEGGDYRRTERMRTVLTKTFNKAKKMNVSQINKIADTVLPKIQTNITQGEIIATIPKIVSYNIEENIGWPYDTKGKTLDRWYGVPVTLESNVKKLHEDLFGNSDYEVSSKVKEYSNGIINKTGYK